MLRGLLIRLLPFVLCGMLPACQSFVPQKPPVEVAGHQATARALCETWLGSLATWADEDTEQTKDAVDYSIRVQKKVCAPF